MPEFISLKELRERVWPLAVTRNLATDMTGTSLPILDFTDKNSAHPYQVIFLLYYAAPGINEPDKITRPYALFALDLRNGELVKTDVIRSKEIPNPLIGSGVNKEIYELPDNDRRNLQDLFFARCDEAAQTYAATRVSPEQAAHLADLLGLFETLLEPPLAPDYETFGNPFFFWLRAQTKKLSNNDSS